MEKMKLEVEINKEVVGEVIIAGGAIMVTPNIDESYWSMRVKVSDNQAVVAFPKFGLWGIGFQKEDDWNTNLPSSCSATKIFNHIKHNKSDDSIPKSRCIEAIKMLQEFIAGLKKVE